MFNDLGFQIKNKVLILVEAQNTFSIKLSVRMFLYLAETIKKYIEKMDIDLYSDSNVIGYEERIELPNGKVLREKPFYRLPTPELYVIYTGDREVSEELDISDLYEPTPDGSKPLSLKVKIIKSSEKDDYISQYIRFCRAANEIKKQYPDNQKLAAQKLIDYCIENNILEKFVKEHKDEVYDMMDVLFNQEYVTKVHEDNLVWQGYNQAKEEERKELERAENEKQEAVAKAKKAEDEKQEAIAEAKKAEDDKQEADVKAKKSAAEARKADERNIQSIKLLMSVQNCTAEQVMEQLGYDRELQEHYLKLM